ncbi:MAG: hypothetical protein HYX21_00115 [Candidatus Yanofskybacteria bacterium]|nr:hypothetical protein [Candidatus Yanofskybacteria bacterium]
MKYIPYIVLVLFVALSVTAVFNSDFEPSQAVFVDGEANIFDSVLSWFGVVDFNKGSAASCTSVRPTDFILSYDDLARRMYGGRSYSQIDPSAQEIVRNYFPSQNQQGQYETARNSYLQCVAGRSSGGGGCVSPRAADFTGPPNAGDPEPNAVRNTSTNAQGVSWETARSTYFQCLARSQQTNQTTTTVFTGAPRVTLSGKITDSSGIPLVNVEIFDNNRVAGVASEDNTINEGQGTLKIGETNNSGEVIFDQEFVDFLKNVFPGSYDEFFANGGVRRYDKVEVSNGRRVVTLFGNVSGIPGGLTARYEYQGPEGLITKTKEITVSNGLMDFYVQMVSGEVGGSEDLICGLVWNDPKTDDGDGIRRIGEHSNVRILLSGFSPNQTVVIKNTNLNNSETRSAPVTVNAQGGFDVYDQTTIRRDEYKVGTYKTEIVDSNQNVLAECDGGFIIKAPIVTKRPKIKSFSPLAGKIGDTIVLKGSNFSLDENKVWLDENYSGPLESDNGSIIEFSIESFSNLFFAENSFAFRVGVENNGGVISKPASNWLTIYQEGEENPLTIESVSPFSFKAGRVASLSVAGKNLSTIKEVNVSSGDLNLVENSLRVTNLGRQRNRVRFKLNVDPNTEPGFYDVVLSDGADVNRTIGFKIEILPVRVTQESILNRVLSRFGIKVQLEKGFAGEP